MTPIVVRTRCHVQRRVSILCELTFASVAFNCVAMFDGAVRTIGIDQNNLPIRRNVPRALCFSMVADLFTFFHV